MANTKTTHCSYILEDPHLDECSENIPPKAIDPSKLQNPTDNLTLGEEDVNVFDARPFSTPAPMNRNDVGQSKFWLSGVHSALTPILKHLNIGRKNSFPEPLRNLNPPNLAVPFDFPAANCQKSTGDSRKLRSVQDFSMIEDERLPGLSWNSTMQLTMDDSVLPDTQPATPRLNSQTNTKDPQSSLPAIGDESLKRAPSVQAIFDEYLPEITLLDLTRDSEVSSVGHMSSINKSTSGSESECKETPGSVETKADELSARKETQQSQASDAAHRDAAVGSCLKNVTLDLPAEDDGVPKDQQSLGVTKTEASLVVNQSSSGGNEKAHSPLRNSTFDADSPQRSELQNDSASLGQRNNTFDCKPPSQPNATITLSEISTSDTNQTSLGHGSTPKASNAATTLREVSSENHITNLDSDKTKVTVEPETERDGSPNRTFEANPASEPAGGSEGCESKDQQSGQPLTDNLSDLLQHQSLDTVTTEAHSFNLDDTLDLQAECLTTSTPMPSCKVFNVDRKQEVGGVLAVQRKLRETKLAMPSNIVSDRRTFFKQPAAKLVYPQAKAASKLLMLHRPVAASDLPMKRQAVKSAAALEEQAKSSISSSYNLRSLASKGPTSGLQRPQLSAIPLSFSRAAVGQKTRLTTAASSSTEKLSGSAAANTSTKNGKKHPLTKVEALPVSKRKKMEPLVPSSTSEAPSSACDSAKRVKPLKQPTASQRSPPGKASKPGYTASAAKTTSVCDPSSRGRGLKPPAANWRAHLRKPQNHGCSRCCMLEEKLRLQSEEMEQMKEELLKYEKQDS